MTVDDPQLFSGPLEPRRRDSAPDHQHELELLAMLDSHGRREGPMLETYRRVARSSTTDEAVRFLVELILEDELRHHELFAQMANELRSSMSELDLEPRMRTLRHHVDPELLAETELLLRFERDDAKELRQLRAVLRKDPKSSLAPLIVELVRRDTQKHVAILDFIRDRLSAD